MMEAEFVVINASCEYCQSFDSGFHARPSMVIVERANIYNCSIRMSHTGSVDYFADAKSIIQVSMLVASMGSIIKVECDGPDEISALNGLADTWLFTGKGLCDHFIQYRDSLPDHHQKSSLEVLSGYTQEIKNGRGCPRMTYGMGR